MSSHRLWQFLFCVLGAVLVGCGAEGGPRPLLVGMNLAYPPFEMTDGEGRPAGLSVDLAEALGRELGRPVEIVNMPFEHLVSALRAGRVDVVISSMTATPERAEVIRFSDPYVRTGLCLLLRKDGEVRSLEQLREPGARVVVMRGTTGQLWAEKELPGATMLVVDREDAAVLDVLQGRADAFIFDQIAVYRHAQRHPDELRADLRPIRTEEWAVGLRRDDDALAAQVNAFLAKYRAAGGFETLGEKHLGDVKAAFAEQGIPFVF